MNKILHRIITYVFLMTLMTNASQYNVEDDGSEKPNIRLKKRFKKNIVKNIIFKDLNYEVKILICSYLDDKSLSALKITDKINNFIVKDYQNFVKVFYPNATTKSTHLCNVEFGDLPNEIKQIILSYLDIKSLLLTACTSKINYQLSQEVDFWKFKLSVMYNYSIKLLNEKELSYKQIYQAVTTLAFDIIGDASNDKVANVLLSGNSMNVIYINDNAQFCNYWNVTSKKNIKINFEDKTVSLSNLNYTGQKFLCSWKSQYNDTKHVFSIFNVNSKEYEPIYFDEHGCTRYILHPKINFESMMCIGLSKRLNNETLEDNDDEHYEELIQHENREELVKIDLMSKSSMPSNIYLLHDGCNINGKGNIIIGQINHNNKCYPAFVCDIENHLKMLKIDNEENFNGYVLEISADGSAIIGEISKRGFTRPVIWSTTTREYQILYDAPNSDVSLISANGKTVVGYQCNDSIINSYIWREEIGTLSVNKILKALYPFYNMYHFCEVKGMDASGCVFVGIAGDDKMKKVIFRAVIPEDLSMIDLKTCRLDCDS